MNRTYQFLIVSVIALLSVSVSFTSSNAQNNNALLNIMENKMINLERKIGRAQDLEKRILDEQAGLNRQWKVNALNNKLTLLVNSMCNPISSFTNLANYSCNPVFISAAGDLAVLYSGLTSSPSVASFSPGGSFSTGLIYGDMLRVINDTIRREIQDQQ